jgi:predicted phage baseplate assembly protein
MSAGDGFETACGCCEGVAVATPVEIFNRPGLSALAYRAGTHARFRESMQAGLSTLPALLRLTTREDGDLAMALLDGWACVLDVLTFYQERMANEGYLRTATERRSLLELARAIGYELRPGVAASTWLAFTLDDSPGSPREVIIPAGTRALSVPEKDDELPQPYETSAALQARPEWNVLQPALTETQEVHAGATKLLLAGVALELQPGDALLLMKSPTEWDLRVLAKVEERPEEDVTWVSWPDGLTIEGSPGLHVYVLRQRASLFGHNAPDWRALPKETKEKYTSVTAELEAAEWPDMVVSEKEQQIELDAEYPRILSGSWIVIQSPNSDPLLPPQRLLFQVRDVDTVSTAAFTFAFKRTRLALDVPLGIALNPRVTAVFAQSEELKLAETTRSQRISGKTIVLEGRVEGLPPGRLLIVQDGSGAETVALERTSLEGGSTTLVILQRSLAGSYDLPTTTIHANVVPATHGETVEEPIGTGDASRAFQRFPLREGPLTYVPAPVPSGGESTLEVRVDGVRWHEAPDFYRLAPRDRKYVLRRDDAGGTTVLFGDGIHGARVPTGDGENVTAVYRKGIGTAGEAAVGQISLLDVQPLGVSEVVNPLPATGAGNPEARDDARRNAPLTVLTLDRIVSLHDYANFARAFSGIGKARADWVWDGAARVVHLTIAAAGGAVASGSELYRNLLAAIHRLRDPFQPLRVDSYEALTFNLEARVKVHPDFRTDSVLKAAESALREAFSFAARDFAQSVPLSEAIAVLQRVEGVEAVDVDAFYLTSTRIAGDSLLATTTSGSRQAMVAGHSLRARLDALPARPLSGGGVAPAQHLSLAPHGLVLGVMP